MINSLQINNFQSHKKTELNFVPGVNIIVGSSDSGKSAIIRALRWLIYNKPLGDAFRSTWGGDTSISLIVGDYNISREKTKKTNQYSLGEISNPKFSEFKALGREVPIEISDILNMDEINLQKQGDGSFLISKNAGEVARHFNRIANLDQIDKGLTNTQSSINKINQDIKYKKEEIEKFEKQLIDFDYLVDLEEDVKELEILDNTLKHTISKKSIIINLLSDIVKIDYDIRIKQKILTCEKELNNILELIEKKNETSQKIHKLNKIIIAFLSKEHAIKYYSKIVKVEDTVLFLLNKQEEIKKLKKNEKRLNNCIENYKSINNRVKKLNKTVLNEQSIKAILLLYENKRGLYKRKIALGTIINNYDNIEIHYDRNKTNLKLWEKEFKDNMPEVCPLCGK